MKQTLIRLAKAVVFSRGAIIARRIVLVGAVAFVFFSPAMTKRQATAGDDQCRTGGGGNPTNNGGECSTLDNVAGTCENGFCIADGGGDEEAPEMPVILVPLFLVAAGGLMFVVRRRMKPQA